MSYLLAPPTPRKALAALLRQPRAKRATGDLRVLKDIVAAVQPAGPRSFRFILSTDTVDRAADVVKQSGWVLDAYRRNPVVLLEHGRHPVLGSLPIGRTEAIGIEGGKLKATVILDPADTPITGPYAEMCRMKLVAGSLFACSVGFRPLEFDETTDPARGANTLLPGLDFNRQELTEWSIVGVPCNPESLAETEGVFGSGAVNVPAVAAAAPRGARKVTAGGFLNRLHYGL